MVLFILLVTLVFPVFVCSSPLSVSPVTIPHVPMTTLEVEVTPVTVPTRKQEVQNELVEHKLPFLRGIDEINRQEFFSIIQNEKFSKAEIWEKVEEWANQQATDVQADILEFHQKLSEHVDNSKARVERIIQNLPLALRRLSEIVQDIDITRLQEKKRIANLYSSLDEDVSKTLQWIVHLVSYEKNEGRQLERRTKLRKLKKGGIWKGSVQATNII